MNPYQLLLYAITDCDHHTGQALVARTKALLEQGVTMVQMRDKKRNTKEKLEDCLALKTLCQEYGVPFIINDDIDLALKCQADGVHLGQADASCRIAKMMLGDDKIIGVSAHNEEEALKAASNGATYLGCGAIFPTASKEASPLSIEELSHICQKSSLPVVAIGGITADNLEQLKNTGIAGVALISTLYGTPSPEQLVPQLLNQLRELTNTPQAPTAKGVICHVESILCNGYQAWQQAALAYLTENSYTPGPDFIKIISDKSIPEAAGYVKHNYSSYDGVMQIVGDWEWHLNQFYSQQAQLLDDAPGFINALQKADLSLMAIGETTKSLILKLLEATGLSNDVKACISGYDENLGRGDAKLYELACQALHLKPAEVLVIDDTLQGIRAGLRMGATTVAIRPPQITDENWLSIKNEAHVAFDHLHQLNNWLELTKRNKLAST